jgi:hypothetical protein
MPQSQILSYLLIGVRQRDAMHELKLVAEVHVAAAHH